MLPQLEAANKTHNWFGIRIINISDRRKSKAAAQYKVRGIPHCMIYDPEGELLESSSKVCWVCASEPEKIKK